MGFKLLDQYIDWLDLERVITGIERNSHGRSLGIIDVPGIGAVPVPLEILSQVFAEPARHFRVINRLCRKFDRVTDDEICSVAELARKVKYQVLEIGLVVCCVCPVCIRHRPHRSRIVSCRDALV